jgi:DNA-directed RNA polymerase specialized sigma24 family protein
MNQNDFVLLVNPFKDKVFRLAKRLPVSTEEAEDATQEVLLNYGIAMVIYLILGVLKLSP